MNFSSLEKINLQNKKVLLRLATNVPVEGGVVSNDFRLKASLPTLRFLKNKKAKVTVIGHREPSPEASLKPVADYFSKEFSVHFFDQCNPEGAVKKMETLSGGEFLFMENLRSTPEEKKNDEKFSEKLSLLGELYINEAFSASHRQHSSIVGVSKILPSFTGLRFQEEVEALSEVFNPERPFVFILGGAKFETKLPLIEKFIKTADSVFVGGALAHNFFKAKGFSVGDSLISEGDFNIDELLNKNNLIIPEDVMVKKSSGEVFCIKPEEVGSGDVISDSGPETVEVISEKVKTAGLVVWNGPLGNYEEGFDQQTVKLAEIISSAKCKSIIGGGDTVASVAKLGIEKNFSFVSTGGGAMLDFLTNETLPGIEAIKQSPSL